MLGGRKVEPIDNVRDNVVDIVQALIDCVERSDCDLVCGRLQEGEALKTLVRELVCQLAVNKAGSTYLIDDLVRLRLGLVESAVELLEKATDNQIAAALERLHGSGDDLLQVTSAPHDLLSEQFALLAVVGLLLTCLRLLAQIGIRFEADRVLALRIPDVSLRPLLRNDSPRGLQTYLAGVEQQAAFVGRRADLLLDGLAHVGQHLEHGGPATALLRLLGERVELALRLVLQRVQVRLQAGHFRLLRLLLGAGRLGARERQEAQL